MKIDRVGTRLRLRDRPEMEWILGGAFVIGGAAGLVLCFAPGEDASFWERVFAGFVSSGVLTGGAYFLGNSPRTTTLVELDAGEITISRRSLWVRQTEILPTRDILDVIITEEKDSEGAPVWQLRLRKRDGLLTALSRLWRHDRPNLEAAAARLRAELGLGEDRPGPRQADGQPLAF